MREPRTTPRTLAHTVVLCLTTLALSAAALSTVFDGAGDNQTDQVGNYYAITGGKFPTGPSPNGARASGGTFRYLLDDPAWGRATGVWHKDGWFTHNAGFALTMSNGGDIVYDNNGIEDGTYGDYYDGSGSRGLAGLYRGYSMSNNFDWVYAGYFQLTAPTTFDEIVGYFDPNGGSADTVPFDPDSTAIRYRMNIWSNVAGDLLPVNTGSFTGDVFSTDVTSGKFSWSDTGAQRVYPGVAGFPDGIYRLTFTPDVAVTLPAGIYWFSHDAAIKAVATNAAACKSDGWASLRRANFTGFKNQGDCMQYVKTGK